MATKTTGAEFKAFYNDDVFWDKLALDGSKVWIDELVLKVNGIETDDGFSIEDELKDDDQVVISYGYTNSSVEGFKSASIEDLLKTWRKQKDTVYMVVQVPKEKFETVKAVIEAAGGKIKRE